MGDDQRILTFRPRPKPVLLDDGRIATAEDIRTMVAWAKAMMIAGHMPADVRKSYECFFMSLWDRTQGTGKDCF